eukprot:gene23119-17508_t
MLLNKLEELYYWRRFHRTPTATLRPQWTLWVGTIGLQTVDHLADVSLQD